MIWPWTKFTTPDALPSRLFPNTPGEYTWEDWTIETRAKYPVRFFVQRDLPSFFHRSWYPVSQALYWLRTHTYNRYHILDLRCPNWGTEYRWGWQDASEQIMVASFQILKRFMEHEFPGMCDWEHDSEHLNAARELSALHQWWTTGRRQAWAAMEARGKAFADHPDRHTPEFKAYLEDADALDLQDSVMLDRLIKVRPFMWT